MINNTVKNFNIITITLITQLFCSSIKLFSDLYLAKFLDISIKLFFSYENKQLEQKYFLKLYTERTVC